MRTLAQIRAEREALLMEEKILIADRYKDLRAIVDLIKKHEFTEGEIKLALEKGPTKAPKTGKEKAPAKYRLENVAWSGLGRIPIKIKEFVDGGGKLDDLLIDKRK